MARKPRVLVVDDQIEMLKFAPPACHFYEG